MYWSHADAQAYRKWFWKACVVIINQQLIRDGEGKHEKSVVRKRGVP